MHRVRLHAGTGSGAMKEVIRYDDEYGSNACCKQETEGRDFWCERGLP